MAKVSSRGSCLLCARSFSKSGMTRHLRSCRGDRSTGDGGSGSRPGRRRQGFHVVAEGLERPQYWMHLEMAGNASLMDLDLFLRRTWLECCGHLSSFVIRGRNHFLEDRGFWADRDDLNMEGSLKSMLRPGMRFVHEYDFGSTTELGLRVISEVDTSVDQNEVRVLARNDPPAIPCFKCESQAAQICTECLWDGRGFYCDDCARLHVRESRSCDEMFLPVVNSPRMGECAYAGPDEDMWVD